MNYCKLFIFLNRILISLSVFDCNAPMTPVEIWRNISAFYYYYYISSDGPACGQSFFRVN